MSTHSLFSPSSSSRWLNCPAAATLAERYPNPTNPAAEEGSLAHQLAEERLAAMRLSEAKSFGMRAKAIKMRGYAVAPSSNGVEKNIGVDDEMKEHVDKYVRYCIDRWGLPLYDELYIEKRVYFSGFVQGGSGTADAIIVNGNCGIVHIVDFKYGRVKVEAKDNTQLMLYALGYFDGLSYEEKMRLECFVLHVYQPRVFNGFSYHTITVGDLLMFGETVKEKSALALADNPERIAGEVQCKWCPARGDCSALAEYSKDVVMFDFDDITNEAVLPDIEKLTSEQRKSILDNQATIIAFMKAVSDGARSDIESGKAVEGYKLVEGRSRRQWLDTAQDALIEKLGDKATATKTITITEAQKLLSKKEVDNLTFKKAGGATLVRDSDKRPAIDSNATFDVIEKTKTN